MDDIELPNFSRENDSIFLFNSSNETAVLVNLSNEPGTVNTTNIRGNNNNATTIVGNNNNNIGNTSIIATGFADVDHIKNVNEGCGEKPDSNVNNFTTNQRKVDVSLSCAIGDDGINIRNNVADDDYIINDNQIPTGNIDTLDTRRLFGSNRNVNNDFMSKNKFNAERVVDDDPTCRNIRDLRIDNATLEDMDLSYNFKDFLNNLNRPNQQRTANTDHVIKSEDDNVRNIKKNVIVDCYASANSKIDSKDPSERVESGTRLTAVGNDHVSHPSNGIAAVTSGINAVTNGGARPKQTSNNSNIKSGNTGAVDNTFDHHHKLLNQSADNDVLSSSSFDAVITGAHIVLSVLSQQQCSENVDVNTSCDLDTSCNSLLDLELLDQASGMFHDMIVISHCILAILVSACSIQRFHISYCYKDLHKFIRIIIIKLKVIIFADFLMEKDGHHEGDFAASSVEKVSRY